MAINNSAALGVVPLKNCRRPPFGPVLQEAPLKGAAPPPTTPPPPFAFEGGELHSETLDEEGDGEE